MLKQDHFGEEIVDNELEFFLLLFLVNTAKDLQKKIIVQIMIYRGCVGFSFH